MSGILERFRLENSHVDWSGHFYQNCDSQLAEWLIPGGNRSRSPERVRVFHLGVLRAFIPRSGRARKEMAATREKHGISPRVHEK